MNVNTVKTLDCAIFSAGKLVLAVVIPLMLFSQTERWIYQYNGGIYNFHDQAKSIAYGADGNIYAAGFSKNSTWDDDLAVISLDQNGSERWVYRYQASGSTSNVAYSLVYGEDGNIYVVGQAHSTSIDDLLVISLDQNGAERWIYRSDSTGYYWEKVSSIIYGADGNLYIAGESNILGSWGDFTIISLDTNGNERWQYRYNGSGNHCDWAESIVFGIDGNLYAAGRTWEETSKDDITVISLDQNGVERWVYQYNGPSGEWDRAHSIVCGLDGNIYIAGDSEAYGEDFIVISLDENGTERWVYRYNGTANNCDAAHSIAYGSDGNVYACGYSCDNNYDFFVASLYSNGSERWVYRYDDHGTTGGFAQSILYGLDNYIYAVGRSCDTNDDFTAISLDRNGAERWVYQLNGTADTVDCARSAAYGLDGNLYIAGYTTDSISAWDFTVISLCPITAIEEGEILVGRSENIRATIFNEPLKLPEGKSYRIFDITGRIVGPDKIQPGIYFIEVDGVVCQKVIKIR
ncbi:MAG: hypothetical protein JSW49_00550 [candidate division WOR-3 bacterium]|nr:MAG: hypothetical protein JSW49_00550 [candidate division WOR-3 bacterium]